MADFQNGAALENGGGACPPAPPLSFGLLKPHLVIQAPLAADAIHFYKRAFGAEEMVKRSFHPKRKVEQEQLLILHAHLKFGHAELILSDELEGTETMNVKSPATLSGTTAILHVETNDVDAAFAQALEAGAKVIEDISDQPWGQRYGKIIDPFGYVWSFATPLPQVADPEEAAAVEAA